MTQDPITICFFVPGIPAPGGSKRFVGKSKKTGKAILVDDAGERNKNWRATVATCGARVMGGIPRLEGALTVEFVFFVPRPKGHKRTDGSIRPGAPKFPVTKPDALKLARSTEDALTGIVWHDDAQTADVTARKRYADHGPCGCDITIRCL